MKILLSGSAVSHGLTASYLRAFEKQGIECRVFSDEEEYWGHLPKFKNRYTHRLLWPLFSLWVHQRFLKTISQEKPDLIFVFKGWFFSPGLLRRIKKHFPQAPLFCFNQENPFNVRQLGYSNRWVLNSIPVYDVYFTWGRFLLERLKNEAGAKRVERLPFACDPELHYPVELTPEEKAFYGADITFIGTWDKTREYWLEPLAGYNLKIWGNGWHKAKPEIRAKAQRRDIYGQEFSKVCAASKIVLDILRPQMIPSHSMKTFEIPACQGFLMCNQGGELADFFTEGKEIVTFKDREEMQRKIELYLKDDKLREQIASAAYIKVQQYTYAKLAQKVLAIFQELKNTA